MKKIFTILFGALAISSAQAQTTVYTTGQTYSDPWTGWTAPVTTNVSSSSVNGADIYTFSLSGGAGASFSIETTRAFSIASNDIDLYLAVTTQTATLSVEYSEDNSSWTSIGSLTYGAGFAQQTLTIPTFAPGPTNFYLKIKLVGTVASPTSVNFNNFKIDADLSSESVSVTPSATQNIITATDGSTLTASEVPSAATSREWKYSTTSGSGYTSFGTAQTGTTYTPNFASVGTYYVICESTFSGSTVTSNEVQINVTVTGGVEEETTVNSLVFFNNQLSVITEDIDYTVSIFTVTGQLVIEGFNLTNYDFINLEKGVYIVNMTSKSGKNITRKITNF